eukprot:8147606-Alexandrium_andersonii.AAC.1
MYGTRDAAQNREECYRAVHKDMGFAQGRASTCVFFHKAWKVWVVIHGDGFTALGTAEALGWYRKGIQARMSTKVKGRLGPRREDMNEMRVLNRIVTWTDEGI